VQDLRRGKVDFMNSEFMMRTIAGSDTTIVNVCDAELVGTTVKSDGLVMNISKEYYGGEPVSASDALTMIKKSNVANLVGKRIVNLVVREDLATEEAVKLVGKTAFLLIYRFT
jgi:hypothetical protein